MPDFKQWDEDGIFAGWCEVNENFRKAKAATDSGVEKRAKRSAARRRWQPAKHGRTSA